MSVEAFFFGTSLFGVWRQAPNSERAWVLIPPFGEEEKSARRTLTDIASLFHQRGESSLIFSFRGTGDSGGDLATTGLDEWRDDLTSAVEEAHRRMPDAQICLLGVRLGASLALQIAAERTDVAELVLIEPLLAGRSFLSQQMMRQKIRSQMTGEGTDTTQPKVSSEVEDLDGWALGKKMKLSLQALDLTKQGFALKASTKIIQVGPKSEVAPPLRALSERLGVTPQAVVAPPFWNLLDYSDPAPLLALL